MAKTPASTLTSYCTAAQYLDFCDPRPMQDLCADDETRLPIATAQASTKFTNGLLAASGEVEAACLKGDLYSAADLAALTGASQQYLIRIVAKLAEARFIQRRPERGYSLTPAHEEIIGEGGILDRLSAGDRIFAFQQTMDAGHLHHEIVVARDIETRDGIVVQAQRIFGRRADRSDPNKQ